MLNFVRWLVAGSVVVAGAARVQAEPWRFAVIGDMRGATSAINRSALSSMAAALAAEKLDVVLVTGDLVAGGIKMRSQLEEWRELMAPVYRTGAAVLPIRGNHEASGSRSAWRKAFPELPANGPEDEEQLTYHVSYRNALFIGLDQYEDGHRVNQPWLDRVLANSTAPHVFVFGHESAYAAEHKRTLACKPRHRDAFWNSLGAAGVRMYFCGHDHFYARGIIPDARGNDVQQLIVGCGGAPKFDLEGYHDDRVRPAFHDNDSVGYVIVEVDGPKVRVRWKAERSPGVFTAADEFSYTALPRMAHGKQKAGTPMLATGTP